MTFRRKFNNKIFSPLLFRLLSHVPILYVFKCTFHPRTYFLTLNEKHFCYTFQICIRHQIGNIWDSPPDPLLTTCLRYSPLSISRLWNSKLVNSENKKKAETFNLSKYIVSLLVFACCLPYFSTKWNFIAMIKHLITVKLLRGLLRTQIS